MNKSCLILLAHGSKKASWRKPFLQLLQDLRDESGDDRIYLSFMESAKPSLRELVYSLAAKGVIHVQVLPLFMASGNHMKKDIPAQLRIIKKECPGLKMKVLQPIGLHPQFKAMMHGLIKECMG